MWPLRRGCMRRSASRAHRNVPMTWTSSIARSSATDALTIGANVPVPAEHTTMSSSGSSREPRLDLGLVGDVEVRARRPRRAPAPARGPARTAARTRAPPRLPRRALGAGGADAAEPPVTIANLPRRRFTHALARGVCSRRRHEAVLSDRGIAELRGIRRTTSPRARAATLAKERRVDRRRCEPLRKRAVPARRFAK